MQRSGNIRSAGTPGLQRLFQASHSTAAAAAALPQRRCARQLAAMPPALRTGHSHLAYAPKADTGATPRPSTRPTERRILHDSGILCEKHKSAHLRRALPSRTATAADTLRPRRARCSSSTRPASLPASASSWRKRLPLVLKSATSTSSRGLPPPRAPAACGSCSAARSAAGCGGSALKRASAGAAAADEHALDSRVCRAATTQACCSPSRVLHTAKFHTEVVRVGPGQSGSTYAAADRQRGHIRPWLRQRALLRRRRLCGCATMPLAQSR